MTARRPGWSASLAQVAVLALTACSRQSGPAVNRSTASQAPPVAAAAAGRQAGLAALPLGPRTFDLAHVDVPPLAAALGRDPDAIFVFVRDQIRFESYRGSLRGPRGTLLALAGNSVDRSALLASLLTSAGHRVRFAHGTLPEPIGQRLIDTMWRTRATAPMGGPAAPADAKAAADRLYAAVKRDYTALHAALVNVTLPAAPDSASGTALLLAEARDHYWVQLARGEAWVDLDPSFADAAPGHAYGPPDRTMTTLPDSLSHRLLIRVRVEERTGDAVASRTVLTYAARTADLSASDMVLLHMPDRWSQQQSPATALSASAGATGQIRPVLLVGTSSIAGATFRQTPAPAAGMGGVFASLGGAGTRHATPIAIAESIDFEISAPGEGVQTVTREVFDRLGAARRAATGPLDAAELRPLDRDGALTGRLFFLFVTTGGIDASHVAGVAEEADPAGGGRFAALRGRLHRVQTLFAVTSDAIVAAMSGGAHRILFYPDSPRIQILELSMDGEVPRLSLDLRRDSVRAVASPSHPSGVFFAHVLRGVVEGTLERALLEYVTTSTAAAAPIMSTSLLFERAAAGAVPLAVLSSEMAIAHAPADALARVHADIASGYLAFAPRQAIAVANAPRWGWWRIDPHTGDTVAITDEGLHQAVEMHMQHDRAKGETTIVFYEYVEDTRVVNLATENGATFRTGSIEMGRYLGALLSNPDLVWFETVI